MKHFTVPSFWKSYKSLPKEVQDLSDKKFELLKQDSKHPSLHFKKIDKYWSVRVGLNYRSLAIEVKGNTLWFWIGNHSDYDKLVK